MKILILLTLLGAGAAQQAPCLMDLDRNSFVPNDRYDIQYAPNIGPELQEQILPGGCAVPDDWTEDAEDDPDSAHVYNHCDYFNLPDGSVPSTCVNDVDLCNNGFSILAGIKLERPNDDAGSTAWFLGFGNGYDGQYGVYVGFQNAQVVVRVITTKWDRRIECQLPPEVTDRRICHWFTLGIVRGPNEMGDIRIFVNGTKLTNCPTEVKRPNKNPPTQKSGEITVGAAKAYNQLIGYYYGGLSDQICFFDWPVNLVEQNIARSNEGCFAVGLPGFLPGNGGKGGGGGGGGGGY